MSRLIYMAEDSPTQALFVKSILRSLDNSELEVFTDGLELYQRVLQKPPDMLILDIILPNISGLVVSRLLKFQEAFCDLPIVVVSSITDKDIADKALRCGADLFLHKPLRKKELISAISQLI